MAVDNTDQVVIQICTDPWEQVEVDAFVCPTNSKGIMSNYPASKLKELAGADIEQQVRSHTPLAVGAAFVTGAGPMKAKALIHVANTDEPGGRVQVEDILRATAAVIIACAAKGFHTIAIPLMGAFDQGIPAEEAARAIEEGAEVASVSGAAGDLTVTVKDGRSFRGSHLLVAVGRRVNTDGMDLHKGGIEVTPKGISVDAGLRSTSNRRVYAVGDAAGGLQFTHVAGYHAGVILRPMLFGLPAKARADHIPWATYTDPELAQVGPTEAEARKTHGDRLEVARFDYAENDRAIATGQTRGFIKVMVVKGRPVGATIVGAGAGDLISIWALAIASRLKMSAVAGMVAPYPTLGEINKRAAGAYFSPRLFDNPLVKRVVRFVQRF